MYFSRRVNRVGHIIVCIWFTSILLFGSLMAFSNSSTNLSNLDVSRGIVEEIGTMPHKTRTANGLSLSSTIFFVRLSGLSQLLAVYYPSQDYRLLLNSIHVGDTLSIYYGHSS